MDIKKHRFAAMWLIVILFGMSTAAYAFMGGKWTGTFEAEKGETTWEYRVVSISAASRIEDGGFEAELNKLGREGWELAEVVTTQSGGYYIMKRS